MVTLMLVFLLQECSSYSHFILNKLLGFFNNPITKINTSLNNILMAKSFSFWSNCCITSVFTFADLSALLHIHTLNSCTFTTEKVWFLTLPNSAVKR